MSLDLLKEAFSFAETAHKNQFRKYNGEPYIRHPERVAKSILRKKDVVQAQVVAAYLHDVVEDTEYTYKDVKEKFGQTVANIVLELTNEYTKENYPDLNRQSRHNLEVARIAKISKEAKLIKLADRLDNLKDIEQAPVSFAKKYAKESLHLLTALEDIDTEIYNEIKEICDRILK